ncbi:uncharacterized protein yc1106_07407 [Curvularia clavata]|uniref:Uncharacterized protein n=1 Tax=Curvularia clavata TaxID=95742 RepID=A0A9Q8ZH99_CURCL|nr:uncharacterized protein yc1106_07407 [Curvularia clavata]
MGAKDDYRKGRHCDYTPFKEPIRQEDDDPRPLVQHYDTCFHADITSRGASELLQATAACVSSGGAPTEASKLSEVVYDMLDLGDVDLPWALAEFGPCIQQWCPVFPTTYLTGGIDDLAQQGPRRDKLRQPLLLLCLWLVTRRTCMQEDHTTQCQLYRTLKQILALLQPEEHIGLETLQISMLLAVYEVGHGMSKQAFQTLSASVSMLKLLDLSNPNPTLKHNLSWLKSSILMLDNTLSITALSLGFPLTILPSDPLSLSLASTLAPTIPPPPPTTDATSPRKVHIRSAVAIATSHVLSYLHTLTHNLPLSASYADVDSKINTCINLLIDKPQPHSWLHCDAIALAFCAHILLQATQTRYLHSAVATHVLPSAEHLKAHLALSVSRRMAWDMVRVGMQRIGSEEEIAELPFAGLCCVVRAGLAVLETDKWVEERDGEGRGVATSEEVRVFRRLVEWFGKRWGVGKGYLARVDEVLERRGLRV